MLEYSMKQSKDDALNWMLGCSDVLIQDVHVEIDFIMFNPFIHSLIQLYIL